MRVLLLCLVVNFLITVVGALFQTPVSGKVVNHLDTNISDLHSEEGNAIFRHGQRCARDD